MIEFDKVKPGDFYKRDMKNIGFLYRKDKYIVTMAESPKRTRLSVHVLEQEDFNTYGTTWFKMVPSEIEPQIDSRKYFIKRIFAGLSVHNAMFLNEI